MEMPAFKIILLHVILLVPDAITAITIIEAAVSVITVHTIPREAILMTDATKTTPGRDPVCVTGHNLGHLDNTTTNHDLAAAVGAPGVL